MKFSKLLLYILLPFMLLASLSLRAQEVVIPLKDNFALKQRIAEEGMPTRLFKTLTPMHLPFFDDFSYIDKYRLDTNYHNQSPFDTLWMDNFVYVNTTMAINPPSIGVATFEGLNTGGTAYDQVSGERTHSADTLTSRPIDLSGTVRDTSLYLSFMYQPQGFGDEPEPEDSLILQFRTKSGAWRKAWYANGTTNQPFRIAIVSVKPDTLDSFYYDRFQFRFVNYASPSGNLDHWHIDYVYLNSGRTAMDTVYNDVALQYPPVTIFKDYYTMPARQFLKLQNAVPTLIADSFLARVKNNSKDTGQTNFKYNVIETDKGKPVAFTPSLGSNSQQINAFQSFTFPDALKSNKNFTTSNLDDKSFSLLLQYTIIPPLQNNDHRSNDIGLQRLDCTNYFAYDDGTAEKGYGLINAKAGKVALHFSMNVGDTLQGIMMHFNQSESNVSANIFNLMVWTTLSPLNQPALDKEETIVATIKDLTPQYSMYYNGWTYFKFPKPVYIPKGDFYVGWVQNSEYVLNVGLDVNYSTLNRNGYNNNLRYNTEGYWRPSGIKFAPMIRPVVGSVPFIGIEEAQPEIFKAETSPNPTSGIVNLRLNENESCTVSVYDLSGRLTTPSATIHGSVSLDYSTLAPGLYLMNICNEAGGQMVKKLVIQK